MSRLVVADETCLIKTVKFGPHLTWLSYTMATVLVAVVAESIPSPGTYLVHVLLYFLSPYFPIIIIISEF